MVEIGRLITAMITPFDEQGEVDYGEAKRLALALIDSGSDGLVVSGTTGESPTLTNDEKLRLFSEVKRAVGDRAAVIAGTTTYDNVESIEMSVEAEREGVDGILCTVPYYNKPPQEGLYRHFKSIAESVHIPCILYNVPIRTSLNMTAETTVRLSQIDNIVGVKEASGDMDQVSRIVRDADDDFHVWSGDDNATFPHNERRRIRGGQRCIPSGRQPDKGHDGDASRGRRRERRGRAPQTPGYIQSPVHYHQPDSGEVRSGQCRVQCGQAEACRWCPPMMPSPPR